MATILVIDDEPGIRGLLATILERKGYEVVLADNGSSGLALFQRKRPDLVLLDLKMPGLPGTAVLRHLHAIDPDVPVVIFTGVGTEMLKHEVRALGAASCIGKEFSLHELGSTLNQLLPAPAGLTAARQRRASVPHV